jgi:hypothetical protein
MSAHTCCNGCVAQASTQSCTHKLLNTKAGNKGLQDTQQKYSEFLISTLAATQAGTLKANLYWCYYNYPTPKSRIKHLLHTHGVPQLMHESA